MNFHTEPKPQSRIEMRFTLLWDDFLPFLKKAADNLSKDFTIKGFRPGYAPWQEVEKVVGSSKLLQEAAEQAIKKVYPRTVIENDIKVIGAPAVEILKIAPDNDFEFKVSVDVLPAIVLPDYRSLIKENNFEKEKIIVQEKEVEEAIKWLAESRAKFITVNREIRKNDRVEADFRIMSDNKVIEGGESKNHPIIIGSQKFIPGFEDNLIGLKEGEEKIFNLQTPQDFPQKQIAGKELNISVKIWLVQEKEILEINDDFVKSLGDFKDLEYLKNNIRNGLIKEKGVQAKDRRRAKILETIVGKVQTELPQSLIDNTLRKMMQEFKDGLLLQGIDFDNYLVSIKKTEEDLKNGWLEVAQKRAISSLALKSLAEVEKIEISDAEISDKANDILKEMPDSKEFSKKVPEEDLKDYALGIIRNEKTLERLENIADNI